MAEFTAVAEQTVTYLQPVIFTETTIPCNRGLIRHENGTGLFSLSGAVTQQELNQCRCCGEPSADYLAVFHADIAVPTGVAPSEISLGIMMDGAVVPATIMRATPTAVEAFFNVGTSKNVRAFPGCCARFSVVNTTTAQTDILVSNAILDITRPDLVMTM